MREIKTDGRAAALPVPAGNEMHETDVTEWYAPSLMDDGPAVFVGCYDESWYE